MNKIWIFGDSFSAGFDLSLSPNHMWRKEYIEWKGNVPPTYYELLSQHYNMQVVNNSGDGNSNYQIFQNFCDTSPYIKQNDFVIFNWSEISRFRLVDDKDSWQTIGSWHLNNKLNGFDNLSQTTINEILFNRINNQNRQVGEVHSWITLINAYLSNCKVIHWTPFNQPNLYKVLNMSHIPTIKHETKELIDDSHFGEIGHKQLFDELEYEIKNYKTII